METTPYGRILAAICVWREARGETFNAQLGVAWVIRNRCERQGWWGGPSIASVVLRARQFSSFNETDPQSHKVPMENDWAWSNCLSAVDAMLADKPDPTGGATHYFDRSLDNHRPLWTTDPKMEHMIDIGRLHFWRQNA